MTTVTTKARMKVAAVATGLAMALSMLAFAPMAQAALTASQVSAIVSLLQSFGADASTIANVQASLTGGTPVTTPTTTTSGSCAFTRSLTIGATGADVTCLQKALIAGGYSIPVGATGYFGTQTRAAVLAWQKAKGVTPTLGFFGVNSRAAWNLGGTVVTPVTPITGTGLKVMLATDSPNNIALVQGQAIGALAKFTFSNPTSADIKVTNLGFKRIGVSNDSTLANVYVYNMAKRLTDSASVSNTAFSFNDPTGFFTVPAGQSYTISVLADIAGSTSGQQIGVSLVSVSSSGTLDSSVSFPINGYTQTVSAATLATADFNATTNPAVATVAAQNDYTVWSNSTTIGTRAVKLESFQLRNIGSVDRTAIQNFRLYVRGVMVGSAVAAIASDDTVTFDLSASPFRIETGTAEIKVVADIIAGSGSTFLFSLRRASDARLVDTDHGQPILATANGSTFSARSATSATVDSGTVSVIKANSSQSSNVALSATNVKWATFELRAAGEDVKVESLDVQANTTIDRGLDNGRVFFNGVQVGSTKDLTDATDVNFTFGSSMILKAGTTAIVDIYADAKSTTGATFITAETAQITLGLGASNAQGVKSLASINTPTADVLGNTVTISSSTLTLTKSTGYGNQTMIAGAQNARLGSFTLSTGATEGAKIHTLTVALSSAEFATITELMLRDSITGKITDPQIGTTKDPSASNAFSVDINLDASTTKTIDIYGIIKSGANAGPWIANIDASATGSVTGSTIDATAVDLQTITLGTAVLTAAVGSTPDSTNVIAGTSNVKVGVFLFTAQYSAYTVKEIVVKIPANAATSVKIVTLKYKDADGVSRSASKDLDPSTGVQTHATATFTGLTFYVPKNDEADLVVTVNVPTIADNTTSGSAISVVLDFNEGFKATDLSGTEDTTLASADLDSAATTGKGTMYPRKSIATISSTSITETLSAGTDQVIGKITIKADAVGAITWKKIAFTVNKTAAVTVGATTTVALYNRGSTDINGIFTSANTAITGTFATTTGGHVTQTQAFTVLATSGILVFEATSEQQIAANSSVTYELRGTVGGLASGNNNISVSVAAPNTSATTVAYATIHTQVGDTGESFVWSDRSSSAVHSETTTDWTHDYLIQALPLTVGSRSVNI